MSTQLDKLWTKILDQSLEHLGKIDMSDNISNVLTVLNKHTSFW